MRTFWLVLVVVLGVCGWVVWQHVGASAAPQRESASQALPAAPRSQPQSQSSPGPAAPIPAPPAEPQPIESTPAEPAPVAAEVPIQTPPPVAEAPPVPAARLPDLPTPAAPVVGLEPWTTLPDFEAIMAKGTPQAEPTAVATPAAAASAVTPAESASAPVNPAVAVPPAAGPAALAPAPAAGAGPRIEEREDGSKLVDGRFVVKGEGTREKPYVITWDLVLSAEDEYAPKDGKTELPARIRMLDGKWVKVVGYVAFPLMVTEADELLVMMNEWDGCCIGIPPTPYDAVEVRLVSPVSGRDRLANFGAVVGRFKVEPHLIGGWLVGLYLMDQATLEPRGYGGFAP